MKDKINIFWFRRDLCLEDNAGLSYALSSGFPVLPIFIFDKNILEKLDDKKDRRVDYIHQALTNIQQELNSFGAALKTYLGNPLDIFKTLVETYDVQTVFCNSDYEPAAIKRDETIKYFLLEQNIRFETCKDQVIFEEGEILKNDGSPYTVYTPYSKKWKECLKAKNHASYKMDFNHFYPIKDSGILSLKQIGFEKTDILFEKPKFDASIIDSYDRYRDFPALEHTTGLGIALRFGTISIRKCVGFALTHNQTWLSELIWREFFMQILFYFPHVVTQSFKKQYDLIEWRNDLREFEIWCQGKTGYPMVDAGMRQLNQTGFMHNRVRMVVASFLCKHLLIDWRWGEAYFAQKLNDYDLSANNGNWQWAAGTGCDAAPYFRVFNPAIQLEKFDKDFKYIKKWLPEFGTEHYPKPMVEHGFAKDRALKIYGNAIKETIQ